MNTIRKILICLAAMTAAALINSCEKDNTLLYNNLTMGNIVNGVFISDQGNKFNIVGADYPEGFMEWQRAFILCDVLNKTAEGEDNEYDIRLIQAVKVLTKDVVELADVTNEMTTQDPIQIENAWISGGYINLLISFPTTPESSASHLINLVHEGEYNFTLRHNAFGDKIQPDQTADYVMAGGYVSFPLNTFITEKEADFSICWTWYKSESAGLSSSTEVKTLKAKYTSEGFQHEPQD